MLNNNNQFNMNSAPIFSNMNNNMMNNNYQFNNMVMNKSNQFNQFSKK